ncbi:uncharacterized protein MYCFIDRAFT_43509 [Pseudocercospora fijiensis CIRAD86]|uniref:Actin cortical patch SUR7/pH-response regulator PalI n=1 Tax=Pseudocercospora fijiensis (strain CIRAD86) TaxID=383855 RepID=M2YM24_PSEFD|nr:uncharacterized protein MYCFIDRAFT_43509 [Pseudocercospora fijiensis CIRAD86]EME78765.1 hypothetical protein MYCFIDRAFT_43509 [Pseudocercospora fijiensis CIRAD86]
MARPRQFQPYAILPVLVTLTAFVLTFLCVFAGNKPGMMDDYAVFTLNVSRIGQNAQALSPCRCRSIPDTSHPPVSKISSALNSAQTSVVEAINDTYMDFIEEMDLSDFYAIHLRTTCSGEFVMPNGTNVTIGVSAPPPNGTEKVITSCDQHSDLNPLIFIRVLYYIAIICLGLALLLSIWSVISFSRKKVIANVIFCLPALGFLALASVSSHGIAIGSAAVLNFLGDGIGIRANKGGKFIALTWATTILVLVDLGLWVLLFLVGERLPGVKDRGVREKEMEMEREKESHELPRIRHLGTSNGEQEKRGSAPWPFAERR